MSYTTRNGFEKIEVGTEVDTWGDSEHDNQDRLDQALDGILALTVSGDRTLVNSNTSSDELHYAIHKLTGTGGRVILPIKEAQFVVINGTSGNVVYTTNNSGTELTVKSGETALVVVDGVNKVVGVGPDGAGLKAYVDTAVVGAKTYADGLAFSASSLPTQTGNAGKFITTNGTTASWSNIAQSNVTNLTSDLAAARAFAIAAAAIL